MSLIYNLDARVKLLFILLFTVLVFLVDKLPFVVCLLLFFIIIRMTVKIPFSGIKYIKNLSLLAAFIILIQAIFGPGDNYIVKPLFFGMGSLKWEGLILGLVIVCRIFSMMIIFPVFTKTTPPYSLAAGFSALGLNYRTSFVITSAFNLISLFKDEAIAIMDAQKLRGMRCFEKRSIFAGLKAWQSLALPLVLGAMRKAQVSSAAMDCRAFGVYKTRTWLDKPRLNSRDFLFILGCVVFFAGILILNYLSDHIPVLLF